MAVAQQNLLVLWLVVALAGAVSASPLPRGANPSAAALYASSSFQCADGSATVAASAVNDDYCDCADGSDEPGTAACARATFYCVNTHSAPLVVASAWVNDGVCDCCDGSDEHSASGGAACANTCEEHGRALREGRAKARETQARGYQLRLEAVRAGVAKRSEQRAQVAALEGTLAQDDARVQAAQAAKAAAEEPEKAAKAAVDDAWTAAEAATLQAAKDALFAVLDVNSDNLIVRDEWRVAEADSNDDGEVSDEEINQIAGFAGNDHSGDGENSDGDRPVDGSDDANPAADDAVSRDEFMNDLYPSIKDRFKGRVPAVVSPAKPEYNDEIKALIAVADTARAEFTAAEAAKRTTDAELNKLRTSLAVNVGEGDEFASLQGQCFEVVDGEYVYELCPFDRVSQKSGGRSTSLGTWGSWTSAQQVMTYENGERCWNGPARSCAVTLVCGVANAIGDVVEPNRCEYTMTFTTPLACRTPPESHHDEL